MDILNEVAQSQPVNLDDFIEATPLAPLAPAASIRNRAAQTALLTDNPESMVDDYQAMVAEAQQGSDAIRELIKRKAEIDDGAITQETIMNILSDTSLPLEKKEAAIAAINSQNIKDTGYMVAMRAAASPVEEETLESEDVRISCAEVFGEIYQYQKDKQSILNKHALSMTSDNTDAFLGLVEGILPFAVNAQAADTLGRIKEKLGIEGGSGWLPGSDMEAIRETLFNMPPANRAEAMKSIVDIISTNSGIIFRDDNDFAEFMLVQQIFEEGGYGTFYKYLDNLTGVLDLIGLGGLVKGAVNVGRLSKTGRSFENETAVRNVIPQPAPVSPLNLVTQTNPQKARDMYQLIVRSEGDEVSQALAAMPRDQVLAGVELPQAGVASGAVEVKLLNPNKIINLPDDFRQAYEQVGALALTEREYAAARSHVVNRVNEVEGITLHDNMTTIRSEGNGITISGMYGREDGGFRHPKEAYDQVKFSFREFGVDENNLTLMKRQGGEYVPVDLADVGDELGDYMVKVDFRHRFNPADVGQMDRLEVKRNFFDRFPMLRTKKSGTVANSLLDHSSMLHPQITGAAIVAADEAAKIDRMLLELHDDFAKSYKGLDRTRQAKIDEEIRFANFQGVEKDDLTLISEGFSRAEIDILKKWRNAWDTHFWFENADLARTLAIQGYQKLESANAQLFAKPIVKNSRIAEVYDPDLDKVVRLSRDELDDLYDKGGTYAQLRRPTMINGDEVEYVLVRNTPNNYLRTVKDTDQVLDYRKGYYQVSYDAPKFIVHQVRDRAGNVRYTKAVGVAGDTAEAEHLRQRLATANGTSVDDYIIRGDKNELRPDTDLYWDLQSVNGRVAQRHRGKRLEGSDTPVTGFSDKYISNPVESAVRAARSLSARVATRESLEIGKQRALQQYGEFFPQRSVDGKPQWTENSNSLVAEGRMTTADIADARTTVEYFNYLQHGYENGVDSAFKALMNVSASYAAKLKASGAERAFSAASQLAPTAFLRNTVFQAMIALAPLRQIIVQSHQSIRLFGYNPAYMASGIWKDFITYQKFLLNSELGTSYKFSKAEQAVIDFIEDSGVLDAVAKSNLVRGPIQDMAEATRPVKRIVGKALAAPRKIGFDVGEKFNLLMHMMAVRDKMIKQGKNMSDIREIKDAHSISRALSYDMNFAGDLPYNQNSLSMFLQFLQVPHKAWTSVTTNRRLPTRDKLGLLATDVMLFGVPGSLMLANSLGDDILPENPEAREAILFGTYTTLLNKVFSAASNKDVNIDTSSLSPYDMEGWADMAEALMSGGVMEMLANSPAASLYFKEGSKVQQAFGRLFRATGFIDKYEGQAPEDIVSVAKGFAEISSGWSSMAKAKAIVRTGMILDKQGNVLKEDASSMDAIARMLGFGTQQEALQYYHSNRMYEKSKSRKDEIRAEIKDYFRYLARDQKLQSTDPEYISNALGMAKLVWEDDLEAQSIMADELAKMQMDMKTRMIQGLLRDAGINGLSDEAKRLKDLGMLNDAEWNNALRIADDINKLQVEE